MALLLCFCIAKAQRTGIHLSGERAYLMYEGAVVMYPPPELPGERRRPRFWASSWESF